jgi:hypothetical protein
MKFLTVEGIRDGGAPALLFHGAGVAAERRRPGARLGGNNGGGGTRLGWKAKENRLTDGRKEGHLILMLCRVTQLHLGTCTRPQRWSAELVAAGRQWPAVAVPCSGGATLEAACG